MKLDFENETGENKKSTGELKEGIISLSSMLNKHGIGTLYFGINNKCEVVGQDISETLELLQVNIVLVYLVDLLIDI